MHAHTHAAPARDPQPGPMRIGESFGDACRHCGATTIIIAPPSSSGRCAVCSPEAVAWGTRLDAAARRRRIWRSTF